MANIKDIEQSAVQILCAFITAKPERYLKGKQINMENITADYSKIYLGLKETTIEEHGLGVLPVGGRLDP